MEIQSFDILPFALPGGPAGEARFEEPRDFREIHLRFEGPAPRGLRCWYLRRHWPQVRWENRRDQERPFYFGWSGMDDQFNGRWQEAATVVSLEGSLAVLRFRGLAAEFPGMAAEGYDMEFRRSLGFKVSAPGGRKFKMERVHTTSPAGQSVLRVELDAGRKTPSRSLKVKAYNAAIRSFAKGRRVYRVSLDHPSPGQRYSGDEGHCRFELEHDTFTVSLESLRTQGPVWYAEEGVYVALEPQALSFEEYRATCAGQQSILSKVAAAPEHSLARALAGQPRAHPVSSNLGCRHSRQKFWQEANGDLVLQRRNLSRIPGKDTARFLSKKDARLFFGLESWQALARFHDPAPVLINNLHFRRDSLRLEMRSLCVPLSGKLDGPLAPDAALVTLCRFRFFNDGERLVPAGITLRYSQESSRTPNPQDAQQHGAAPRSASGIPLSPLDPLEIRGQALSSRFKGLGVVRAWCQGLRPELVAQGVKLEQDLAPGESCDLVVKVPYVALAGTDLAKLAELDFDRCDREVRSYWRRIAGQGSRLSTPEPALDTLHAVHPVHVAITDSAIPGQPGLVNTSVGTSTYGNYTNESCMIVHELDQRGLHEEARQRLQVWIKYQGTARQPGNFTDYRGMYFGAGGFEDGAYNQHHGWALWCLAEHYFLTRDTAWLKKSAASMVQGADWIHRQRRNTRKALPFSRGLEKGFLPAGSLEDVEDFHYWLSTNCLTWRGAHRAAQALEAIRHPQAGRLRREADAYAADLRAGFEAMRQVTPLVRLRDGRWVPHYPSRVYSRGRDFGWIREVLEGAVYLLISGLYPADSRQAKWILDDYQDNLYLGAPYGYPLADPERGHVSRGGFSMQPNLLAGLMPHLERDEPEAYLWMYFNAFAACWREEISALIEHPSPELGYSNAAHFKTSDQANSINWMRYMIVWAKDGLLHLGRAVPRAWFEEGQKFSLTGVATVQGPVDAAYSSSLKTGLLHLEAVIPAPLKGARILARFRHPQARPILSVKVNGKVWNKFDPVKGDVDLSGLKGRIAVTARYGKK